MCHSLLNRFTPQWICYLQCLHQNLRDLFPFHTFPCKTLHCNTENMVLKPVFKKTHCKKFTMIMQLLHNTGTVKMFPILRYCLSSGSVHIGGVECHRVKKLIEISTSLYSDGSVQAIYFIGEKLNLYSSNNHRSMC